MVADAGGVDKPLITTNLSPFLDAGNSDSSAGYNTTNTVQPLNTTSDVTIETATDVFGMLLILQGSNNQGQSAQGSAAFWISKGPNPTVPNEGRAIATVEIDCTNMEVKPLPLNFDEFSSNDESDLVGAVVVEFDLQRLNMSLGRGFSDCKALSFFYRPAYQNGEDFILPNKPYPAFITNLTTRQTVPTWGNDLEAGNSDDRASWSHGVAPFLCNVGAMKVRVLIPQGMTPPSGKLTLQFYNFDVPPYGPVVIPFFAD
jgi:hypothetical protein